tara:strand:- start:3728 stop:3889 length:162 start_codon:yes stop_codon:yes gene_type:complete
MITVKKEHLNTRVSRYNLTLGEMNQNQLEGVKERHGDKWFEKQTKKKKNDSTD